MENAVVGGVSGCSDAGGPLKFGDGDASHAHGSRCGGHDGPRRRLRRERRDFGDGNHHRDNGSHRDRHDSDDGHHHAHRRRPPRRRSRGHRSGSSPIRHRSCGPRPATSSAPSIPARASGLSATRSSMSGRSRRSRRRANSSGRTPSSSDPRDAPVLVLLRRGDLGAEPLLAENRLPVRSQRDQQRGHLHVPCQRREMRQPRQAWILPQPPAGHVLLEE